MTRSPASRCPAEIRWTGDASGAGARFRLVFGYEPRPAEDQRQLHRWGASWQRLQRLGAIRYEFDGGTGFGLVHRYTLTYATGNGAGSGRSQLASIQQCGPTECLPATTFGWQTGVRGFEPAGGRAHRRARGRRAASPITTGTGTPTSTCR